MGESITIPAWLAMMANFSLARSSLLPAGRGVGAGDGTGAGGSRGGRSHHLPESAREAQHTVIDAGVSVGGRGFALRYYRRKERESCRQGDGQGTGRVDILVNNAANYETADSTS